MEELNINDEVVTYIKDTEKKEISIEETPTKRTKTTSKNNEFKTRECNVITYNKYTHTLDVNFKGYGIRIKDVKDFNGDIVLIKYKGEIGNSNFKYKL